MIPNLHVSKFKQYGSYLNQRAIIFDTEYAEK